MPSLHLWLLYEETCNTLKKKKIHISPIKPSPLLRPPRNPDLGTFFCPFVSESCQFFSFL